MNDHAEEKGDIEVRNKVLKAASERPAERHHDVCCVVDLTCIGPPAVDEQRRALCRGEVERLLETAPVQVREGPSVDGHAAVLESKVILLALARVPDVVRGEEHRYEEADDVGRFEGLAELESEIHRLLAVEEGHACKVPEAKHPAKLFVGDVPCRGNIVFT